MARLPNKGGRRRAAAASPASAASHAHTGPLLAAALLTAALLAAALLTAAAAAARWAMYARLYAVRDVRCSRYRLPQDDRASVTVSPNHLVTCAVFG